MARPKKYSAAKLAEAVEKYFLSITRTVPVTEKKDSGQRDERGHVIFEDVPVVNNLGEPAMVESYIVPPTVGGLCAYLGIHRSTWAEWCDTERYPQFSDTTTRARGRMQAWQEEQLLTRKDVKGIIFSLQNNYGYAERKQLELGGQVRMEDMTLEEKQEMLRSIAEEFREDGHGEET